MARGYNGSAANYHLGTNAPLGRYPATLIGRYKKSSDVTTEQCMSSIGVSGGSTKLICVEIFSGGILALAGDGSAFTGATKTGALADSAWHSFCGVFRDHQWRIAGHDGVFGAAETTTRDWLNLAPTMNRVTVGALFWSPTTAINPFNGELAECAFLQTALSEAEFLAWHNGTHGGRAYTIQDMRPGTCRAYYPLNDGVGNEANYCSKYANLNYDLTEQGTVTQTTHPTVAAFVPDGMFRPLLSNQRVWSDGSSERILAGAHTWPGIVQHMFLTRQSVSDTFDRSGGVATALGSNWTNEINANQIATNDTAEPTTVDVEAVSRWTGSYVTGADQFAVIAEAGLSGSNTTVMGPVVRCDAGAQNMYYVAAPPNGTLTLFKRVAGVNTSLGTFGHLFAANKQLYLEAVGTAIKVYLDGVLRISVTDSSVTSGLPGFRMYHATGDGCQMEWFRGGNLASSTTFYGQDYTTYLDALASYGHNYTRLWGWDFMRAPVFSDDTLNGPLPYGRSGTAGAYDGGNKFDLTTLDATYFTRLVDFVAAARTRGIICSVVLWEMSLAKTLTAGHPFTSTNNVNSITGESGGTMSPVYTLNIAAVTTAQLLYLRHVLDLLGGYWNVQYELGNEPFAGTTSSNGTTSGCAAWQDSMSKEIREYELANCAFQHMVVAISTGSGANDQLEVSASRAPDASQVGDGWVGYSGTPNYTVPEAPAQSLILDSDHISNNSATFSSDVFMRAICQGHSGVLFMEDGFNFAQGGFSIKPAIRSNLGSILQFTRRMTLALARPSGALASTGFCLAYPGFQYLAYQPGNGSFTVNLSAISGTLDVDWLNTNDGTRSYNNVVGGNASQLFTPPFAGSPSGLLVLISTPTAFARPTSDISDGSWVAVS